MKYGASLAGVPIRAYLEELKDAGLGSLPGTSAEVLDDAVRARIAPGRISTAEWVDVIRTAHGLGLPTTSTLMFGHVETDARADAPPRRSCVRSRRRRAASPSSSPSRSCTTRRPCIHKGLLPDVRPGPTGDDVTRLFAIARLMLGATFRNIQASWVKEGMDKARELLACGANDLGGTLINESISTAAGAGHGQLQSPAARCAAPSARRGACRCSGTRSTARCGASGAEEAGDEAAEPLDALTGAEAEARFGSYAKVARDERYRFKLTEIRRRAPT